MIARPIQTASLDLLLNADAFNRTCIAFRQQYPHWDLDQDIRLSIFPKYVGVLGAAILATQHLDDLDVNEGAFPAILYTRVRSEDRRALYLRYEQFIKFGGFHSMVSITEAAMRIVAAAVYPELDANTAFHNVYKALLGKQRLNQPIWVPFLDLLRCTRNTIHNNGIYTPAKRGEQGPIRWQGRQYVFRPGQAIDFFSWSFLFHCFHDMDRFLAFFIGHPVISALPMIRDPVAESE